MNKGKDLEFDSSGVTSGQLVKSLKKKFAVTVGKTLLGRNHNIDMEIRVVLNNGAYLVEDRMDIPLKDWDTLLFL